MPWHEQEIGGDTSAVMPLVSRDLDRCEAALGDAVSAQATRQANRIGAWLVEFDDPEQAHISPGLQHLVLFEGRAQANVIVE